MLHPDEIIRSKRKTLSIVVDASGRLLVRAPMRCSEERIFAFLREKEGWILRKQAERKGAGIRLPGENLHGYEFLLLGERTKIQLYDEKRVAYDATARLLFLPSDKPRERLVKWLKENAKRILSLSTKQWAEKMGANYERVTVASARTRWGSCTGDNAIRYTFRLLYCPREIIDYVVVHELSHTRQKNHSKYFWAEVERYIPDWKLRRKWLKSHGILTEIF